ncbi:hypothetical protein BRADI_3g17640v3 [Brachypodium distachyon]|uniref:Photosystem II 10 kDa polypeptide, chloroplastic n=1 Tax=Brachypodium distachyon TaxID=15368 RepID=I1I1U2_BRADI|nr:hypothetical protein BRADI_3g17640v3 [Brachypodium distachyon]
MAASMITSPLVAPTSLPSLSRRGSNFAVVCSGGKKIKVDKPLGIGGGLTVDIDANGRKGTGKGVYQFVDKYGANVDGYRDDGAPDLGRHPGRPPRRRRPPRLQHQRSRRLIKNQVISFSSMQLQTQHRAGYLSACTYACNVRSYLL